MIKSQFIAIFAVILTATTVFSACDSEEPEPQQLVVRWNIAGLNVCKAYLPDGYAQEELVFTSVAVNIYEDESQQDPLQEQKIVACDAYHVTYDRLSRGSYYVTVDAYAAYDGEALAFFSGESPVSVPDSGTTVDIPLMVGRGQIEVTWQFAGDRTCGLENAGEVAKILVSVDDEEYEASCGDGRIIIEDVYPDNTYRVTAVALDSNGDALYDAVHEGNPFEVLPGQTYPATVVFQ